MIILLNVSYAKINDCDICESAVMDTCNIKRLCNNVDDIICKDTKPEERRDCDGKNHQIFNKQTSKEEVGHFIKTCFGSAVTSFAQFFTEFIPELLKGIWDVAKSTVSGSANTYQQLKGAYESVRSLSADVFEFAKDNPNAFISVLWDKISENVGPLVANYDCLKPELKIKKACGLVGQWVVPPRILAAILVKGSRATKAYAQKYGFGDDENKIAAYVRAQELKDQKILNEFQSSPKPIVKDPPRFSSTEDFFTVKMKRNGESMDFPAQIMERTIVDGKEVAYRFRVYDQRTGTMKEWTMTTENILKLYPGKATNDTMKLMDQGHIRNPQFKQALEEFKDQQKNFNERPSPSKNMSKPQRTNPPQKIPDGMEVEELAPNDPRVVQMFGGARSDTIEFIPDENAKNLKIIKTPNKATPAGKGILPGTGSGYLTLQQKNSMGYVVKVNAQILRHVKEDGRDKFIIKYWDETTQSTVQKTFTENELKVFKAVDAPSAEKSIEGLKRSGHWRD